MDKNIETIREIFACGHSALRLRTMSNFFAPNFTYKSVHRGTLNFEEFCQNFALIYANCEVEIASIEIISNRYVVALDITIIHSDTRKSSKLSAKSIFHFEGGKICNILSKYRPTPMQLVYILKSIFPFSKVG